MPQTITTFKVFIASPRGLQPERECFRDTITDHNDIELQGRGLLFTPVGWEVTLGGVGRPQELINRDLKGCDYFVLVLWDRWGSPTNSSSEGGYTSGCEEEFDLALKCLADPSLPMRQVVVLFKDVEENRLGDAGPQLARVMQFKKELLESKKHLFMSFATHSSFQKVLRAFLSRWTLDHEHSPAEHARLIHRGTTYWNSWRMDNPDILPNLLRANLRGLYLRGIDLSGANLARADLSYADLVDANLRGADLSSGVMFRTNLFGANLTYANLSAAMLAKAHMRGVNLSGATFGDSVISETDLSGAIGVDTVTHSGPTSIDHRTIQLSGNSFSRGFLRAAGLPDLYLDYLPSLLGQPIQFYSCFISYSTQDQEFANRLFADLQNRGVRCWFAPQNLRAGEAIRVQLNESIRIYDRVLLILSEHSMASEWVKTEIALTRQREIAETRRVLFPISLVRFDEILSWKNFDADTGKDSAREIREYFIPDFTDWKQHDAYTKAFERLMRDLKAEGTP